MTQSSRDGQLDDGAAEQFGRWVRSQRARLLLTQEQLAERAKVSVRTIRGIEAATGGHPRPHTRSALIGALGPAHVDQESHGPAPLAQLPADVGQFVGREAEVARLDELFGGQSRAGVSPAVLITGGAGTGKTALAVHWGHRASRVFPDGQLYADLRGYDPSRPVEPTHVLRGFLVALGLDEQALPASPDARSALFRTKVSDRRLLVVLDNVASEDQVRPLLPASASCGTLVTSRDALPGLVVRNDVHRIELGLLSDTEALDLIAARIGTRARSELDEARALAARCARLPLALCIAAERAAAQPGMPLRALLQEFDRQRSRLDLLDVSGDERTALRTVFSWSLRHLSAGSVAVFDALGLHPTGDVDAASAAALAGVDLPTAQRALDALTQAHLVLRAPRARHRMHDLIREYARERAVMLEEAQRESAVRRLCDHLLATTERAVGTLDLSSGQPASGDDGSRWAPAEARGWLEAELAALVATASMLRPLQPEAVVRLAGALGRYFEVGGHYGEAVEVHTHALAAARAVEDLSGEANAYWYLGMAHYRLSRTGESMAHLREALRLFVRLGSAAGEAAMLANLGALHRRTGDYEAALDHLVRALERFRAMGDRGREAKALDHIGLIHQDQGRWQDAREQHRNAVEVARAAGDRLSEAMGLDNLGMVLLELGEYDDAVECLTRAGNLAREFGDRLGEAATLTHLAGVDDRQGRSALAVAGHQRALSIAREIGEQDLESEIEEALGVAHLRLDMPGAAVEHFRNARRLADLTGDLARRAGARTGLGRALLQTGRVEEAVDALEEAVTVAGANEHHRARAQAALTAALAASR